jgi:GH15 family glucan-1,4-alpha-glucosidase
VGDKRTVALIGRDGTLHWMCLPRFDGDAVFGSLLDRRRGGRFELAPAEPFDVRRRYLPDTNVLETTFTSAGGKVRITDALTLAGESATPYTELVRRIDGIAGRVTLRWQVEPRPHFGHRGIAPEHRAGVPVFQLDDMLLAVQSHGAGEPTARAGALGGEAEIVRGDTAALVMGTFAGQPMAVPDLGTVLRRLGATADRWRRWASRCEYDGPWRDAVMRSALALDLLADDESGALLAAATTSLPERVGGARNYDYRFAWLRDANLTLEAMMRLGYRTQVQSSMAWMFGAIERTGPMLRPIYRADGTPRVPQDVRDMEGYRGSHPVHVGNSAESQLQLGSWGDLLDATWHYVQEGHVLHPRGAQRLVDVLDFVARVWDHPDASLWELHQRRQYTQSKLACWIALQRGAELADAGQLPAASAAAWRAQAARIRAFVEDRCWSDRLGAWARAADDDGELDAAVLLASRGSFVQDDPERLSTTVDAIDRELGAGSGLLYRYSGMRDREGAFVACSFWAIEALARAGRLDEAAERMDTMVGHVNDVGLLSEEIDPGNGEFRGNFPQALSHLALINAADVVRRAAGQRGRGSARDRTTVSLRRSAAPPRA